MQAFSCSTKPVLLIVFAYMLFVDCSQKHDSKTLRLSIYLAFLHATAKLHLKHACGLWGLSFQYL